MTAVAAVAPAGTITVSGYVKDAQTGEAIIGAVVYTPDKASGVSTNEFGFYSITVSSVQDSLVCACVGYVTSVGGLTAKSGNVTLDFKLSEDSVQLDAAKVFSRSKKEILKMPQMGAQTVDAVITKKMPSLMGEPDIIRVIQMLPGVQTPSEGSTGFSVRGGGVDQNLLLMDGAPIYNCGHFLGFFSMFNSDAVKNAQLYKGDFPAKYGGKTSSVLDITTVDGNMNNFGGNASIGLIASKIFLEGPIVKEKASFMFSARRSYVDLFFPLLRKYISENTKLSFYDINAKLNWQIGDNDRLYFSAFNSDDVFGLAMADLNVDLMCFDYKNNIQSIRWNHVYSPKLFSNVTLYNSRYKAGIDCDMEIASFTWESMIRETGIKGAFTWYLDKNNTVEYGASLANIYLNPSETHPSEEASFVNDVKSPDIQAYTPSLYVQDEMKLDFATFRFGLRFSSFTTCGKTDQYYYDPDTHERTQIVQFPSGKKIQSYCGLEPRFSASFPLNDASSIKASYARSIQYVQQAVVSISGSVLDAWICASPNVKPQKSDQFSVGYNQNLLDDALEFTLEGFYKNNKNTLDLKDNPGLVIDNIDREGLLRFGKSWAYGAEAMVKFDFAKLNGWLAYTWSKAFYKIDGINNNEPYRSPINHEHTVNAVINYDINSRMSASASWVFYSGAPTTYPIARYLYEGTYIPLYSKRNEDSMPDYHRLDLSYTIRSKRRVEGKRWSGEWNFSIYNAYSRHNAWAIVNSYNSQYKVTSSTKLYIFTVIPSVSYNIKF